SLQNWLPHSLPLSQALPSSQAIHAPPQSTSVSPPLLIPSSQAGAWHRLVHSAASSASPSSHTSTPAFTAPSPHFATRQVLKQSSVSSLLPSSQPSPGWTSPSPQLASAHASVHSGSPGASQASP